MNWWKAKTITWKTGTGSLPQSSFSGGDTAAGLAAGIVHMDL